jgi:hypothetical protein
MNNAEQIAREIAEEIDRHVIYYDHDSRAKMEQAIAARLAPLASAAERWRYVRNECIRADPKMDGTSYFMFRQLHDNRGLTIEEVIDRSGHTTDQSRSLHNGRDSNERPD